MSAGRPSGGYFNAEGKRLPGVTSITGRGKDSGGLVFVAKRNWHEAGRLGLPFERDAYWSGMDGKSATLTGSIVHQWIDDTLRGAPLTGFDESDAVLWEAQIGFTAFQEWAEQFKPEVVETEMPLVSEEHQYAGTPDAVALVGNKRERVLLDWKTSNGTYPDYIAQVAAYRQLLRERDGDTAPRRGALLRVGKEHGDFHYHSWPEQVLDLGWQWFLAAKSLYDVDARLKKVSR